MKNWLFTIMVAAGFATSAAGGLKQEVIYLPVLASFLPLLAAKIKIRRLKNVIHTIIGFCLSLPILMATDVFHFRQYTIIFFLMVLLAFYIVFMLTLLVDSTFKIHYPYAYFIILPVFYFAHQWLKTPYPAIDDGIEHVLHILLMATTFAMLLYSVYLLFRYIIVTNPLQRLLNLGMSDDKKV